MSRATLGFEGGPSMTFRLNPQEIDWKFDIITAVTETLGGRVIQVVGSDLSDIVITGQLGEVRGTRHIESWKLAEAFFAKIKEMMKYQAVGADKYGKMGQSAVFTYEPLGIRYNVYIKDIQDPDGGGGVTHRPGKFSYSYVLTLFIVQPRSARIVAAGETSDGVVDVAREKAIQDFMARISDGVGWKFSETWNGPLGESGVYEPAPENAPGGSTYESQVPSAAATPSPEDTPGRAVP